MTDSINAAADLESASGLRKQLEAALAVNQKLTEDYRALTIEKVIRDGASFVKPEDLTDVPVEQVAERAAQIQQDRVALREEIRAQLLAEQAGQAPEATPATVTTNQPASQAALEQSLGEALSRVTSLGNIGGVPPVATHQPKSGNLLLQGVTEAMQPNS